MAATITSAIGENFSLGHEKFLSALIGVFSYRRCGFVIDSIWRWNWAGGGQANALAKQRRRPKPNRRDEADDHTIPVEFVE